jgi:hypothetical protein
MTANENNATVTDKLNRDKDELEFLRIAEINHRTRLLMERDNLSYDEAHEIAKEWISSEIGQTQLTLPIEPVDQNVYRIYYRRLLDERDADYHLVNVVAKGKLYDWRSTNAILADIIRDRHDELCDIVVTFHPTSEHDIELSKSEQSQSKDMDELSKRRRIAELEEQIKALKEQ